MRAFILVFLSVVGLQAGQSIVLGPQTLTGWTVVGAEAQTLAQQPRLTLPAGAQLAQTFDSAEVSVRLTSQLTLGLKAEDWPVLEIGDSALVFTRDGSAGKLSLVVGANAPQEVPLRFDLDSKGASVEPVTLSFARHGSVIDIDMSGQKLHYAVDAPSSRSLEVVASAGEGVAWDLNSLEVTIGAPAVVPTAAVPAALTSNSTASASDHTAKNGSGRTVASSPTYQDDHAASTAVGQDSSGAGVADPKTTLVIFTPPAVRHGRAAAVRATAQTKAN